MPYYLLPKCCQLTCTVETDNKSSDDSSEGKKEKEKDKEKERDKEFKDKGLSSEGISS